MTGIDKAVELATGAVQLAARLGVSHQAVFQWIKRGWVPLSRAIEIEGIYGIPRHELLKPELVEALHAPTPADTAADLI